MGVDPDQITVSGYSFGSSVAMDILVAYSDIFAGAELFMGNSFEAHRAVNYVLGTSYGDRFAEDKSMDIRRDFGENKYQ